MSEIALFLKIMVTCLSVTLVIVLFCFLWGNYGW